MDKPADTASIILTLHHRYEAAHAEYDAIDRAQPAKPTGIGNLAQSNRHDQLGKAMKEKLSEIDLLQSTILCQFPRSDAEITILAYHCHLLTDSGMDIDDRTAGFLRLGTMSILDFLISEGRLDMEAAGPGFSRDALIVYRETRDRFALSLEEER